MSEVFESTAAPLPQLAAPTLSKPGQRIDALDLLRGIAILGIFLMNTWTMSLPQDAYTNPATYSPDWVLGQGFPNGNYMQPPVGKEYWTYTIIHLFADMKFITTFSILFGAGIVLQSDRAVKKGRNPWATHYLRMSVLLIFGLIHTFCFWYGDILTDYAMSGMILAPLRKLPASLLFLMGILLISCVTWLDVAKMEHQDQVRHATTAEEYKAIADGWYKPLAAIESWQGRMFTQAEADWMRNVQSRGFDPASFPQENDREIVAYRGLGELEPDRSRFERWWDETIGHRFWCSVIDHTSSFLTWTFLRCGGCFLLGMALQKRKFFHAAWPREAYATIAAFAIPIGWIISYLGVRFMDHQGWAEGDDYFTVWHLGGEFNYWGSLLTALGYISFGVLLGIWAANPLNNILRKCLIPIRAVGRMALTCYLTETLIGTTIFYGHGLARFGTYTRYQLLPIVFLTWIFLLVFATLWLTYFRQGPLEWFWHSLVYWDWRNPRKSAAGPDSTEAA